MLIVEQGSFKTFRLWDPRLPSDDTDKGVHTNTLIGFGVGIAMDSLHLGIRADPGIVTSPSDFIVGPPRQLADLSREPVHAVSARVRTTQTGLHRPCTALTR
jgi:hypothetical protein